MPDKVSPLAVVEELKRLLSVQIKLDIATEIRHDPHLEGSACIRAYEKLTTPERIDQLVEETAHDEAIAAINRGEVPGAALLLLAGFAPNIQNAC